MKSGFIHIKDNKICMINKAMSEILNQNREISNIISDRKEEENVKNLKGDDKRFASKNLIQKKIRKEF